MKTKHSFAAAISILIFIAPSLPAQDDARIVADNLAYSREFYAGVHFSALASLPVSFAYDRYPDNGPERIRCDQGTFARKHGKPWLKSNDWGETGQPASKEIARKLDGWIKLVDAAFNPAAPDVKGTHVKDSLTREQFGGAIGFPIKKDKTFLYSSFEGLLGDAQNAVPLLTNTNIFRPDSGQFSGNNQVAIINGLATLPGNPSVPCIANPAPNPPTFLPAATCAGILTTGLTVSPVTGLTAGQIARNKYVNSQFESNGGLFPYNNRLYLTSTRFDHQFSDRNQVTLRYSFGHDLEQNPDVTSLTGFSRGSSVKAFDNTLLGSWFHQFSPRTLNEARVQWNYANFDVNPRAATATGYIRYGLGPLRPAPDAGAGWMWAAGELAMTASDLAKWDICLIRHCLLSPQSYRELEREIVLNNGAGTGYTGGAIPLTKSSAVINTEKLESLELIKDAMLPGVPVLTIPL